jgi:hypothetical protein
MVGGMWPKVREVLIWSACGLVLVAMLAGGWWLLKPDGRMAAAEGRLRAAGVPTTAAEYLHREPLADGAVDLAAAFLAVDEALWSLERVPWTDGLLLSASGDEVDPAAVQAGRAAEWRAMMANAGVDPSPPMPTDAEALAVIDGHRHLTQAERWRDVRAAVADNAAALAALDAQWRPVPIGQPVFADFKVNRLPAGGSPLAADLSHLGHFHEVSHLLAASARLAAAQERPDDAARRIEQMLHLAHALDLDSAEASTVLSAHGQWQQTAEQVTALAPQLAQTDQDRLARVATLLQSPRQTLITGTMLKDIGREWLVTKDMPRKLRAWMGSVEPAVDLWLAVVESDLHAAADWPSARAAARTFADEQARIDAGAGGTVGSMATISIGTSVARLTHEAEAARRRALLTLAVFAWQRAGGDVATLPADVSEWPLDTWPLPLPAVTAVDPMTGKPFRFRGEPRPLILGGERDKVVSDLEETS